MRLVSRGAFLVRDDNTVQADTIVWDLAALRRHYGIHYEISHIGLTWYAWPDDGHLTRAITALTGEELRAGIITDLSRPKTRIPRQQAS